MRILFFTKHYFDSWGGIEENILNISNLLSTRHSITITTPYVVENTFKFNPKVKYIKHSEANIKNYDCILIENFNIFPHLLIYIKLIISSFRNKDLPKFILIPHGGYTLDWGTFTLSQRIFKAFYHKTFGIYFINRYCDMIVAVSEWEKAALIQERISIPITVIRNGYAHQNENLEKIKKEDSFIFIGRIEPIKNLEEIIITFDLLSKTSNFQKYHLKIIGDYKSNPIYSKKLFKLVKDLGLSGKVAFVGSVFGLNKYKLLAQSKCLFLLSNWENDPVVIKEALSVQTKILINSKYGLSDYSLEENVFLKNSSEINENSFLKFINEEFNSNLKLPLLNWEEVTKIYEKFI